MKTTTRPRKSEHKVKKERSKPSKIPAKPVKPAQSRRDNVKNSFAQHSNKKEVTASEKKGGKGMLNKNKSKGNLGRTMKTEKPQVKNGNVKPQKASSHTQKNLINRNDDSKLAERRTNQLKVNPKKT